MPKLTANKLLQSFSWDFSGNKGQNGIAGTYQTGIQIPQGAIFTIFYFYCFASAAPVPTSQSISIGTSLNNSLVGNINAGNFTTADTIQLGEPNAPSMDNSLNILFTLSGPTLTSGIVRMYIEYLYGN